MIKRTITVLSFLIFLTNVYSQSIDDWKKDIDLLAGELIYNHIDPFKKEDKNTFLSRVRELKSALPLMERPKIICGLMELIASIGDGHTYFMDDSAEIYPFQSYIFNNGHFLTNIIEPYKKLLGQRITHIDGIEIKKIINEIKNLISHDNEIQLTSRIPVYLSIYEVLMGKGIIKDRAITITLENYSGYKTNIKLKPVSIPDFMKKLQIVPLAIEDYIPKDFNNYLTFCEALPQTEDPPLYQKFPGKMIWEKYIEDEKALFIGYNFVRNSAESILDFSAKVKKIIDSVNVEKVVVDVRENVGGNSALNKPLIEMLSQNNKIDYKGKLFVIIGRRTFSAATNFVAGMENRTKAIFIGEPTGGAPNHYGSPRDYSLSNSNTKIKLSTVFHVESFPMDNREATMPDLHVSLSSMEYFNSEDPVLNAAFNYETEPRNVRNVSSNLIQQITGIYEFEFDREIIIDKKEDGLLFKIPGFAESDLYYEGGKSFSSDIDGLKLKFDNNSILLSINEQTYRCVMASGDFNTDVAILWTEHYADAINKLKLIRGTDHLNRIVSEQYLNGLGYSLMRTNKLKAAMEVFRLNTQFYPSSYNVWDSLGEIHFELKEYSKSRTAYEKSLKLNSQNSNAEKMIKLIKKNVN